MSTYLLKIKGLHWSTLGQREALFRGAILRVNLGVVMKTQLKDIALAVALGVMFAAFLFAGV